MSQKDSGVGQSTMVDIQSDPMQIPSGLITNPRKPTSVTVKWHFSVGVEAKFSEPLEHVSYRFVMLLIVC